MIQELLKRNQRVVATARNLASVQDLADKGALTFQLDVTWPLEQIKLVAERIIEEVDEVHVLINNAGGVWKGAIENFSPEQTRAAFETS